MPRSKGKTPGNAQRELETLKANPAPVPVTSASTGDAAQDPRPLTEAEKAEMEANPLPSGDVEQTPPTAAEVLANQDKAYPVVGDNAPKANTFMQGVLKCHTCGRTGDEDLGECPNRTLPTYTCPEPTVIDPEKDAVLYSPVLGITRTVPIQSLVKGHVQKYLPACHQDDCGYKLLYPKKG